MFDQVPDSRLGSDAVYGWSCGDCGETLCMEISDVHMQHPLSGIDWSRPVQENWNLESAMQIG